MHLTPSDARRLGAAGGVRRQQLGNRTAALSDLGPALYLDPQSHAAISTNTSTPSAGGRRRRPGDPAAGTRGAAGDPAGGNDMSLRLPPAAASSLACCVAWAAPSRRGGPADPRESTFQDDSLLVYNTPTGVAQDAEHAPRARRQPRARLGLLAVVAPTRSRRTAGRTSTRPTRTPIRPGRGTATTGSSSFAAADGIARQLQRDRPGAAVGDREAATAGHRGHVRAVADGVRRVRACRGHALQRQLRGAQADVDARQLRSAGAAAAGRLLVDLERAEPGRLADAAAGPRAPAGRWSSGSPTLYRGLVDAACAALAATGHADDTILVGETAPEGPDRKGLPRCSASRRRASAPARSSRCTSSASSTASTTPTARWPGRRRPARGCPTDAAGTARFAADHPGLFAATGWAHHPYELIFAPNHPPTDTDFVTIANLGRLSDALQRILARLRDDRRGGLPLYLTEFGYQSRSAEPDRRLAGPPGGLPQRGGVHRLHQPARADAVAVPAPRRQHADRRQRCWPGSGASFQTGLEFHSGRRKPAYAAYRLPVYLPNPRVARGHRLRVWGFVRMAPYGTPQTVQVQLRRTGQTGYQHDRQRPDRRDRGYLDVRVPVPGSGLLRLSWTRAGGHQVIVSRSVGVRVT